VQKTAGLGGQRHPLAARQPPAGEGGRGATPVAPGCSSAAWATFLRKAVRSVTPVHHPVKRRDHS
jgi:hypothetical protein